MIWYISVSSGAIGLMGGAFNLFFTLLAYSDLKDGGLALQVHITASRLSQVKDLMAMVILMLRLMLLLAT
jgi:hypothetical protein